MMPGHGLACGIANPLLLPWRRIGCRKLCCVVYDASQACASSATAAATVRRPDCIARWIPHRRSASQLRPHIYYNSRSGPLGPAAIHTGPRSVTHHPQRVQPRVQYEYLFWASTDKKAGQTPPGAQHEDDRRPRTLVHGPRQQRAHAPLPSFSLHSCDESIPNGALFTLLRFPRARRPRPSSLMVPRPTCGPRKWPTRRTRVSR